MVRPFIYDHIYKIDKVSERKKVIEIFVYECFEKLVMCDKKVKCKTFKNK